MLGPFKSHILKSLVDSAPSFLVRKVLMQWNQCGSLFTRALYAHQMAELCSRETVMTWGKGRSVTLWDPWPEPPSRRRSLLYGTLRQQEWSQSGFSTRPSLPGCSPFISASCDLVNDGPANSGTHWDQAWPFQTSITQ